MNARWADYYATKKFGDFWTQRLREEGANVCVLFGLGFDPRCLAALRLLAGIGTTNQVSYVTLRLQTPSTDVQPGKELQTMVAENATALSTLANATGIAVGDVMLHDGARHPIGGRS